MTSDANGRRAACRNGSQVRPPGIVPMVVALIGAIALVASVTSWFPPGIAFGLALIARGLALGLSH